MGVELIAIVESKELAGMTVRDKIDRFEIELKQSAGKSTFTTVAEFLAGAPKFPGVGVTGLTFRRVD